MASRIEVPESLRGPQFFTGGFELTTKRSTKPVYEPAKPAERIPAELLMPEPSLPDLAQAVSFNRDVFVGNNRDQAPEIKSPFLASTRARVAEIRAGRIQSRLERLHEEQKTITYIGERVLKGMGYTATSHKAYPDNTYRPHRLLEKGPGTHLARIHKRRLAVTRVALNKISSHPEVRGKKQTFRPFFDQYDKGPGDRMQRSWGERRAMGIAARKYRNNDRMARLFYDKLFNHVATKPSRDAKGLPEKRDKLVLKAAALREQQKLNKGTRRMRRASAAIHAQDAWRQTKSATKKSSSVTKEAINKTRSKARSVLKNLRQR